MWLGEVKEVEEEPVSGCMNLLKAHKMQSIFSGITHKSGRKTQALTASLHLSFPRSLSLSLSLFFYTLCAAWQALPLQTGARDTPLIAWQVYYI